MEGCKVRLDLSATEGFLATLNGQEGRVVCSRDVDEFIVELNDGTKITLFASEFRKVA